MTNSLDVATLTSIATIIVVDSKTSADLLVCRYYWLIVEYYRYISVGVYVVRCASFITTFDSTLEKHVYQLMHPAKYFAPNIGICAKNH